MIRLSITLLCLANLMWMNAHAESLEALQAQLRSIQACQRSIQDKDCELNILDADLRENLIRLHELRGGLPTENLATNNPRAGRGCYESSISSPTPFLGNHGEIFKLSDGTVWEVMYEYEYLYEYYPSVTICPGRGKLMVGKKSLDVQNLSNGNTRSRAHSAGQAATSEWLIFEETSLMGSISGTVQQGRIFKTSSGNVYEVTGLTLQLVLELQPDVLVLRNGDTYKLIVEGFDEPLLCRKLN
jgi:hypothetical protein